MADPNALPPLPPGFTLDTPSASAQLGRPVIRKGPDDKPEFIPGTHQVYDPNTRSAQDIPNLKPAPPADKTLFRPMTVDEKTANHLSPDAPWQISSTGEFKLPDGYKPATADDNQMAKDAENKDAMDALVLGVRKARGFINSGDYGIADTATGGLYNLLQHSPFPTNASKLKATIDQEIRGNIFLKRISDLKATSDSPTGGTGIGRIMQAEIPLITGALGTLDPGKYGKDETLKSLDQIERSALRSKAIAAGENPDDPAVQQKYGILPVGQHYTDTPDGAGTTAPLTATPPPGSPPPAGPSGGGGAPPPIGPTLVGGVGNGGEEGLSGTEKVVVDPNLARIAPQLAKYLAADPKQISNAMILGFMKKNGVDPSQTNILGALQYRISPEGAAWRRKGGNYGIDPKYNVPLTGVEKTRAEIGASGPGAAAMNYGNAATAGLVGPITGDQEAINRGLAAANAAHPGWSLAGTMAGAATAGAGLEGALAKAGMGRGLLRSAVSDATYGGTVGATQPGATPASIAENAAIAAAASAAGSKVTQAAGSVVKGVTNPAVGYVAKEEVPLTIGQALSGKAKAVEDRLSGIPVVGDVINARRLEGLQKMNAKAFDRALEPIKESVSGQVGEQAVAEAQDKVSQAFNKALAGKSASLDRGFISDATKAKTNLDKLPPRVRDEVNNQIDDVVHNYFDDNGNVSGQNMQAMLRELGQIKQAYRNDPLGHRIGNVVYQFTSSVENMFQRQAPDVMPQYNAAKQAFKRVSTLEDAVLRAKNTNGVFTPGQLGLADRANTINYGGKHVAAAGKGEFHDFQRNMQEVLPNKVPDSGTAGRLIIPAAIIGAGGAGGEAAGSGEKGLTLGALLALAYTKTGQRALTASVLKRTAAARGAGQAIQNASRAIGHGSAGAAVLGLGPRE